MMPSLNILVTQRLSPEQEALIQSVDEDVAVTQCKLNETHLHIANADILLTWGSLELQPLLKESSRLRWVHTLSAGVDGILSPEFAASDIILTNSRGIHGIPVSEHVLAMILNATRCITQAHENQKAHTWKSLPTEEIYDKTIAIIGLGSIGREIAKRAKALGMKVLAMKQSMTTELFVDRLYGADCLADILPAADFIVATLPLTPETKGMFNLEAFQKMKNSAFFINIARGQIVQENALCVALTEKMIRGAALDVFPAEPLPSDSPLWDLPGLFITPHIAAKSPYYIDRALKLFTENLVKFTQKSDLLNTINKSRGY